MKILFSTQNYHKGLLESEGITLNYDVNKIREIFKDEPGYMLDTETCMEEILFNKSLYLVQIGTLDKKVQIVFDVCSMTPAQEKLVRELLSTDQFKYIHNALFEYNMIKKHFNIDLNKMRCTYTMSRLMVLGLPTPDGYHSLRGLAERILKKEIDKTQQTTFHSGVLSIDQLNYAFEDVIDLYDIYLELEEVIDYYNLQNKFHLKCAAIRSYGDIMSHEGGLYINTKKWLDQNEVLKGKKDKIVEDLNSFLTGEFLEYTTSKGYYVAEDKWAFKWTSAKLKKAIFKLVYGDCVTSTSKKFLLSLKPHVEDTYVLDLYEEREFDELEAYLVKTYPEELKALGIYTPKGAITLNWGSPAQRLHLFQQIYPELTGTGEEALKHCKHPLITTYKSLTSIAKSITSYGELFIERNRDADGKVRPHKIDMFLTTGRIALGSMMTIPANNNYRNCFYTEEGRILVGADFGSQELCIAASMAKCQAWIDTMLAGADLHSSNSGRIFGKKWSDLEGEADEHGCWNNPVTPEGIKMRKHSKAISFGMLFGGGPKMLANRLNISMKEAKELIASFFGAFPELKNFLEGCSANALDKLYSESCAPFYGKRFYEQAADPREEGAIKRAGRNHPVQGSAAEMTELAMVYLKKEIDALDYDVFIKLVIHDEIWVDCPEDKAEEVKDMLEKCMCRAGLVIVPEGIIGADAEITKVWKK